MVASVAYFGSLWQVAEPPFLFKDRAGILMWMVSFTLSLNHLKPTTSVEQPVEEQIPGPESQDHQ